MRATFPARAVLLGLTLGESAHMLDAVPDSIPLGVGAQQALAWIEQGTPLLTLPSAGLLGWLYQHDETRLLTGVAANSAAAYALKLALDGVPLPQVLPRLMTFTAGMSDDLDAAIYRVGHAGAWTSERAALDHISEAGTPEEAVALALYSVIRHPDDFAACIRLAARAPIHAAAVGGIAGALIGGRLGWDAIPPAWCERIAERDRLMSAAARLESMRLSEKEQTGC